MIRTRIACFLSTIFCAPLSAPPEQSRAGPVARVSWGGWWQEQRLGTRETWCAGQVEGGDRGDCVRPPSLAYALVIGDNAGAIQGAIRASAHTDGAGDPARRARTSRPRNRVGQSQRARRNGVVAAGRPTGGTGITGIGWLAAHASDSDTSLARTRAPGGFRAGLRRSPVDAAALLVGVRRARDAFGRRAFLGAARVGAAGADRARRARGRDRLRAARRHRRHRRDAWPDYLKSQSQSGGVNCSRRGNGPGWARPDRGKRRRRSAHQWRPWRQQPWQHRRGADPDPQHRPGANPDRRRPRRYREADRQARAVRRGRPQCWSPCSPPASQTTSASTACPQCSRRQGSQQQRTGRALSLS
jgi:hypothetical protein